MPETLFTIFPSSGAVVATPMQVEIACQLASFLYIPGEICRQADVLEAAAASGKRVLLERGAFLSVPDVLRAVEKLSGSEVVVVEAGSSFGYSDRILDPRSLALIRDSGISMALQLSELISPRGEAYRWTPGWNADERFVEAYIRVAESFGVKMLVCDETRHSGLARDILATSV
jgi:3-deoxy-D-manno-octulosonic acid (KDO) 8-phosphate synthase